MSAERRAAGTLVGEVLDARYRIESLVGEGGMGAVYSATDLRLDKCVAIKVIRRGAPGVYVNGLNTGVKMGLLIGLSGSVAAGVVADLTYIRSVTTPQNQWCEAELPPPCADPGNTVLGSLAGALLF